MLWAAGTAAGCGLAAGQAMPTAQRGAGISVFAGVSGVYTGLNGSRNLAVTAGGDFSFLQFHGVLVGVEVRGSYPVDRGKVVAEENVLGGVRFSGHVWRVRPYGDVLFGRGELDYGSTGYPAPSGNLYYTLSDGNVLAAGGGAELPLSTTWAVRGEVQIERYQTPVTASGNLNSTAINAALVYHFHFR
jgi:hypothetical protein